MSKDLYVKNLPLEMTEEELRRLFAVAGKVSYVHMVKDVKSGEFVGCAYVKMASEAEARDAIVCLDEARVANREIVVVEALPQRTAGSKTATDRDAARAGKGPAREAMAARGPKGPRGPADAPGGGKGGQRPAGGKGRKPAGPGAHFGKGRPGKSGGRGK
ncbi:MAG: hypothetical protein WDA20_11985 [Desulfuromonadales bacterium]